VNFYRVGNEMYWADLPGYGYARVPERLRRSWDRLASDYLGGRPALKAAVVLVDARRDPTEADATLGALLDHYRLPRVIAANKADKLGRGELARRLATLRSGLGRRALAVLPTSATRGDGVAELGAAIRAAAGASRAGSALPRTSAPDEL
jgi:GTP-binding protein